MFGEVVGFEVETQTGVGCGPIANSLGAQQNSACITALQLSVLIAVTVPVQTPLEEACMENFAGVALQSIFTSRPFTFVQNT